MTTVARWLDSPGRYAAVGVAIQKTKVFLVSLVVSYLGVLGLLSFVVAGFLLNRIIGFVVLGVVLLILDKAVKREANS